MPDDILTIDIWKYAYIFTGRIFFLIAPITLSKKKMKDMKMRFLISFCTERKDEPAHDAQPFISKMR